VIVALLLISAVGGIAYLILGGIGNVASRSTTTSDYKEFEEKAKNERADNTRTLLPGSEWNKLVGAAAKVHCPVEGMTKEEVEQALGKPVAAESSSLRYERKVAQPCTKFSGDNCAEPTEQLESETFSFSPNGHLIYQSHSERGGSWLDTKCFSEPFYAKYYKPLSDKSLERSQEELKRSQEELNKTIHELDKK
jgi:hypothetical protein